MSKDVDPKNVVLYADDDFDDLQIVKDSFSQYSKNIDLVTVTNGIQALSFLKNLPPHETSPCLIILDINMPIMDGKETLVKIRELNRFEKVPAILFTTSSQPSDKDFATRYNAGFLTKPIDYNQMNKISDQFIEHCNEEIKKKIQNKIK
jgi:CheY-like chemotaxis protein